MYLRRAEQVAEYEDMAAACCEMRNSMIALPAQLLRKEYGGFPIDLPQLRTSMMMLCSIACSSRVLSCALLQSAK